MQVRVSPLMMMEELYVLSPASNSVTTFERVTFQNNWADQTANYASGGAIYITSGTTKGKVEFTDCVLKKQQSHFATKWNGGSYQQ